MDGLSTEELRTLLTKVEAHGGPVRLEAGWVFAAGKVCFAIEGLDQTRFHDWLVGVLKRNLVERGLSFYVHCSQLKQPWTAEIRRNGRHAFKATEYGYSELEALLKAWLAAASLESWQP